MPRKDKCFSTCRKRPKTDCDPPECRYTNGNKYSYCRLSFTHKMNKDCVPELRNRKNNTAKRGRTPRTAKFESKPKSQVMDLHPSKSAIAEFREKYAKKEATRKIGRFLRKHDPRVRSKFLQSVCSDAGVCIAFGKHAAAIRKHFDNFDNFALLDSPAKTIGAVSSNGFVKELTYKHRGYVANAILKSSVARMADNLLYEALVGFQLNKYSARFPSFLETYGLYEYARDGIAYNECKTHVNTSSDILNRGLFSFAKSKTQITRNKMYDACHDPVSMAVLIQHLKEAKTLSEKMRSARFNKEDLHYVLFQVYMTLASLSSVFTHYDLHWNNVLVYEPVKGKYIEYHYNIDGEEIVFKSPYIAKIIDYGRCYFNDLSDKSPVGNSKAFYEQMCKVCADCGVSDGFYFMKHDPAELHQKYHICSQINNPSHDLRLLHFIGDIADSKPDIMQLVRYMLKKVVYGIDVADVDFGTAPNPTSGLPSKINNVKDAFEALTNILKTNVCGLRNELAYSAKDDKLGELHVYNDGRTPMRFVQA